MQTIVCMKWGNRYGDEYVNRLWSMIKRNTRRPTRLICFTERPEGIHPEVERRPLPEIDLPERVRWLPWRKLSLWNPAIEGLGGDVLFLDLDMVITGSLDDFFDYEPGAFGIVRNWTQPRSQIGNTSLYRWKAGSYPEIYTNFQADPEKILRDFRIEQQYISHVIKNVVFWPPDWCVSFKHTLLPRWPLNLVVTPKLPINARVVAFTGKPDPDEAAVGHWPEEKPWKRIYKRVRPTPWIAENWR